MVVALVLLALGVLLTLRLTSTVTSPVGGYAPVRPSASGAAAGVAVPTAADLRGQWQPRVLLGEPVDPGLARRALVTVRASTLGAFDGCNTHTLDWRLDGDGGFAARERAATLVDCPEPVPSARALERADEVRLVRGRLQLLDADGTLLGVLDRVRR